MYLYSLKIDNSHLVFTFIRDNNRLELHVNGSKFKNWHVINMEVMGMVSKIGLPYIERNKYFEDKQKKYSFLYQIIYFSLHVFILNYF